MKIERRFLRSKVARRVLLLFIICALIPLSALCLLSFSQVSKQLRQQIQSHLHRSSKAMGMTFVERLTFLEAEMEMVASNLRRLSAAQLGPATGVGERLQERFRALGLISASGSYHGLFGPGLGPPTLSAREKEHLESGRTLLFSQTRRAAPARILLCRALDVDSRPGVMILGEVKAAYLWGTADEESLGPAAELCVLDAQGNLLFSSLPAFPSFPQQELLKMRRSSSGHFTWQYGGREYVAGFWSMFMKYEFLAPKWILVLSEAKDQVLAPMARFRKSFPLVVLLSLWVVLLLSISQIRRSLIPLEKLQEGTRRLGQGDFDSRVNITSGDEFQELAASFNEMSSRLAKQFRAMRVMNEIDRSILSELSTEKIVDKVLSRLGQLFPCDAVGLAVLDAEAGDTGLLYHKGANPSQQRLLEPIRLTSSLSRRLYDSPEKQLLEPGREDVPALASFGDGDLRLVLLLPFFVQQRLAGVLLLGYHDPEAYREEDQVQARQLADQVAVAMSNARLLERLDEFNWGTLYALARAIDAKSSWTAGHSERVTRLAMKIGSAMGLEQRELDELHRGGLLHDIGKIGIDPKLLDKPGKLTDEEYRLIQEHVRIGAKILEPIKAYAGVIPVVLHHHEYFDGTGYPDGLAGEEIDLRARIFTVADHYDAMISDRPYRRGLKRKEVIDFIKLESGRKFDPRVIQALLRVVGEKEAVA